MATHQTNDIPHTAEDEIRDVVDRWVGAFRRRSTTEAMAVHMPTTVSFDIVPPLRFAGEDAYRAAWDELFDLFETPITMEVRDLSIVADGKVAFLFSLNRFTATSLDGERSDYWFRWTAGLRQHDGRWLIEHDHTSLPTDFSTGRAVMNLQP